VASDGSAKFDPYMKLAHVLPYVHLLFLSNTSEPLILRTQ